MMDTWVYTHLNLPTYTHLIPFNKEYSRKADKY